MVIVFIGLATCSVGLFFLVCLGVADYIARFFKLLIKIYRRSQESKERKKAHYEELVARYRNIQI